MVGVLRIGFEKIRLCSYDIAPLGHYYGTSRSTESLAFKEETFSKHGEEKLLAYLYACKVC